MPNPGDSFYSGDKPYYIGMIVDDLNAVAETNEGNNSGQRVGDDYAAVTVSGTVAPFVTVTSPNGGQSLQAGSSYNVTWTDNISENVKVDLFKGGVFAQTIFSSILSDGSESWVVPTTLASGSDYQIKVSSANNTNIFDFGNNYFTVAPYLTMTSLNGGETLLGGASYLLDWADNISENVKIDLYKGDVFNTTIFSSIASIGDVVWTVPTNLVSGSNYRVKISSVSNGNVFDFGDNYFSIDQKVRKYAFTYYYNVASDNSSVGIQDRYDGYVYAPVGHYVVGSYNNPNPNKNESGFDGKYYISRADVEGSSSDLGKVYVTRYYDNVGVSNYSSNVPYYNSLGQASGTGYLGSEYDYIGGNDSIHKDFGRDAWEYDVPWKVEYFGNLDLAGSPTYVEYLSGSNKNFTRDWGTGSVPNTPVDNFSARFTTTTKSLSFIFDTLYQVRTTADNGVRVYVDGKIVIDRWIDEINVPNSGFFLSKAGDGSHTIQVDYYERTGGAQLKFELLPVINKSSDAVDTNQNWNALFYTWDKTKGEPPLDFYMNNLGNPLAIAQVSLGSNVRSDGKMGISADWGVGTPNNDGSRLPSDAFAVRSWTQANFDGSEYTFKVRGDDGFQIFAKRIDNGQWYWITPQNQWTRAYGSPVEFKYSLPAGRYDLHFQYFEIDGPASIDLSWQSAASANPTPAIIPLNFTGVVTPPQGVNLRNSSNYDDRSNQNKAFGNFLSFDAWTTGTPVYDYNNASIVTDRWFKLAGTNLWVPDAYINESYTTQPQQPTPSITYLNFTGIVKQISINDGGGVNLRNSPNYDDRSNQNRVSGTTLSFDAWTTGTPVYDYNNPSIVTDRWFRIAGTSFWVSDGSIDEDYTKPPQQPVSTNIFPLSVSGWVVPSDGVALRNSPHFNDKSGLAEPYDKTLYFDAYAIGDTVVNNNVWYRIQGTNYWVPEYYISVTVDVSDGPLLPPIIGGGGSGGTTPSDPDITITGIYDPEDGNNYVITGNSMRITGTAKNLVDDLSFYLGNNKLTQGTLDWIGNNFVATFKVPLGNYKVKVITHNTLGATIEFAVNTPVQIRDYSWVEKYIYQDGVERHLGIEKINGGYIENRKTWVVIHGWNNSYHDFADLAAAIDGYEEGDQVLTLDWDAARTGVGVDKTGKTTLSEAAKWIAVVAKNTADILRSWGISAANLNLVGFSLGAYVSSEIGRIYKDETSPDLTGLLNNLILLDPAYPGATYDIGGGRRNVANFSDVAKHSVAFVVSDEYGIDNGAAAGDNERASTANYSFLVRFQGRFVLLGEADLVYHGGVRVLYTDLVRRNLIYAPNVALNQFNYSGYTDGKPEQQFEGIFLAKWENNTWVYGDFGKNNGSTNIYWL